MYEDNVYKLKAATLYILNKCGGELDYIHLFKILYFAERRMYAEYGIHLIKDIFYALPKGPVPSFLYDAVKKVSRQDYFNHKNIELLSDSLSPSDGELSHFAVKAKYHADMDWLSEADVEILDWAIDKYKDVNIKALSEESHDSAWEEAYKSRKSDKQIKSLSIAKAGGANDEFIEFLREQELLEDIFHTV